jgi:hypothetical protein
VIAALAIASIVYGDVPDEVTRVAAYRWQSGRSPVAIEASVVRNGARVIVTVPASADTVLEFRRRNDEYLLDGPMTVAGRIERRLDRVWRRTVSGSIGVAAAGVEWLPARGLSNDAWPWCWSVERTWTCAGVPIDRTGVVVATGAGRLWSGVLAGAAPVTLRASSWGRLVVVRDGVDDEPFGLKMAGFRPGEPPPQRSRSVRIETVRLGDVHASPLDASAMWVVGDSSPPSAWLEIRSARAGPAFVPLAELSAGSPQVAVHVLLERTRTLEAAVVSERGDPGVAALVTVFRLIDPVPGRDAARDRPPPRRVFAAEAIADEEGRVRVDGIGDAVYEIVAWHPVFGRRSLQLSVDAGPVTLRLQSPGMAHGRVLVRGRPASGVDIIAVPDPSAFKTTEDPIDLKGGDARTGADGRFVVALAAGGGGELRVGGGTQAVRRIPLPRAPLPLVELGDIELGAPIAVSVAIDQDLDCDLRATGPIGRSGLQIVAASRAGPGLYRLTLPEEGAWELGAVCGGDERPVTPPVVRITAGDRPQEVKAVIK